jgi:DNA-binding NtrC family response regulator
MRAFVERTLPGQSASNLQVQRQILEFVASPTAKAVLLRGPIGSGKSTIARVIALLKRVAPLSRERAAEFLHLIRFAGPNQIDVRHLTTWYVELPLTGLVETLAEAQLFGSVRAAYNDAVDRAGVFETASRGRAPKGRDISIGARITKGVVFLDEIGDLSEKLQAKLLPVLSGGVFYRVGGEGKEELEFRGVTITASWKDLGAGRLRPDLLSRIAPYAIDVPGVDDRIEDFDLLLDGVQDAVIRITRSSMEELCTTDPDIDRGYWRARMDTLKPLQRSDRDFLRKVPWGPRGNLRGLTAAVEQILSTGTNAEEIVANLTAYDVQGTAALNEGDLLSRLLLRDATGDGLAAHVRTIEREGRTTLRARLQADRGSLIRLSEVLGIEPEKLRLQARDLDRDRRTGEESR